MLIEDIVKTSHWVHRSYEKIAESFDNLKLTVDDYRYFKKLDWVVTEKIHGANFCILTDGDSIRYAKRKEILLPEEDFFGHQTIKSNMAAEAERLFRIIQRMNPDAKRITIYGELFGGDYPNTEVNKNDRVEAVQTGICYSPNIGYCVFDVAVESGKELKRSYLDYDKLVLLLEEAGIIYAQPLFTGKFNDALNYNIRFKTKIPGLLGLPELEGDNYAEGVVVKPVKAIFLETAKGLVRPIIKMKIPEFDEEDRYHQASKWKDSDKSWKRYANHLTDIIIDEIHGLININRLNNTISKIGRVSKNNDTQKSELAKLMFDDVIDSFNTRLGNCLNLLNNDEVNSVYEYFEKQINTLIEQHMRK